MLPAALPWVVVFLSWQPDRDWECDLEEMESLIDEGTRAIVINNPSNPCGSVYTKVCCVSDRFVAAVGG